MNQIIAQYLGTDSATLEERWQRITGLLQTRFDRDMTIEALLFLIGIQSHGKGFQPDLKRERKQELIMEGTYCAFETLGIYERAGMDEHGLWLWEQRIELTSLSSVDQEKLLRVAIVRFFEAELKP